MPEGATTGLQALQWFVAVMTDTYASGENRGAIG
jgi:hypothetical protein